MHKIHVRNIFSIYLPLDKYIGTVQTKTEPEFGFGVIQNENQLFFKIRYICTDMYGKKLYEPQNCFTWAKRAPIIHQQSEVADAHSAEEGMLLRLKINQGVFDFRKTKAKDRFFQIIIERIENGSVTQTGSSSVRELFPKKRKHEGDSESEVVVPIFWFGEDGYLIDQRQISPEGESSQSIQESSYGDDTMHVTDPNETNQYAFGSSLDHPFSAMVVHDSGEYDSPHDNYMVLYNGNAEVVGNFRALNFYKASDINIKEDIELLQNGRDCRATLLRINGVSYKFKPGVSHATNKRFIGYIAQQIESVVPEAVQLIDGILHVDYESLIPFMSESIKQNYNDIQNVTSEVDHIQRVIDALYDQFTGSKMATQNAAPNSSRRNLIGWKISAAILSTLVILIMAVVGLYLFSSHTAEVAPTLDRPPGTAEPPPNLEHLNPANYERHMLLELLDAMHVDTTRWLNVPHCTWTGISCSNMTGRVIGININSNSFKKRTVASSTVKIPAIIGNFTELHVLDLTFNSIESTIPESIIHLKNLKSLKLAENRITGTLPDLRELPLLKEVELYETWLSLNESSLAMLMNLPSMEKLDLNNCRIEGTLPQGLSKSLLKLDVSGCGLHGTIPTSWEDSNIQYLAIDRNNLNGSIPCLGKRITKFYASDNDFEGEFCGTGFTQLTEFSLTHSKLAGVFDLPNTDFNQLSALFVNDNLFTSFLPSAMNVTGGPRFCTAAANPIQCPIPEWAAKKCNAICN